MWNGTPSHRFYYSPKTYLISVPTPEKITLVNTRLRVRPYLLCTSSLLLSSSDSSPILTRDHSSSTFFSKHSLTSPTNNGPNP